MTSQPAIGTEALSKRYGRHRGIEDVTFVVQPGEVFGFLGPNGAGKATIRTLLDLIHPTSGSARLFGLDGRRESVAIRARLGNLPGDFGFGRAGPALARQPAEGRGGRRPVLAGAGLDADAATAGFANVWPPPLLFAGFGVVAAGFSLRTSVVTGSVAGVLVAMYVVDLVGKLDPDLDGLRYLSVFKYYGNAIEDGIEPLAFFGLTVAACLLAALGAWLFERRDLAA